MCGINGFAPRPGQRAELDIARRMNAAPLHCEPDERGDTTVSGGGPTSDANFSSRSRRS